MNDLGQFVRHAARCAGGAVGTVVLWAFWFVLLVGLIVQAWITTHHQMALPEFAIRMAERRLEQNGVRVTFHRATFDPTGRVLIDSPRFFLAGFEDPVVTARAAYVAFNPWLVPVGRLEIREVQLEGGALHVPAMLSPSGQSEPLVQDISILARPNEDVLAIPQAVARIGRLPISVHGAVTLVRKPGVGGSALARMQSEFPQWCRTLIGATQRLDALDEPALDLELLPSATRGAIVVVDGFARHLTVTSPEPATADDVRVRTRLPLTGDLPTILRVGISAANVAAPQWDIRAAGLHAVLRGRIDRRTHRVEPLDGRVTLATIDSAEGGARSLSAAARADGLEKWDVALTGRLLESALHVDATADLTQRAGEAHFSGDISPAVLDAVNRHMKKDIRSFFVFDAAHCERGAVVVAPGGHFERLTADVTLGSMLVHGVAMDEGRASVVVTPDRLVAPDAYARIGDNFARGSYEHHFASREFRFLLDGRLRPMDIAGWFRSWWPRFFERMTFPVAPPAASVDVQGYWGEGRKTAVFVFADAGRTNAMSQPLARVRTRVFVRPGFYDVLELHAQDAGGGVANGTFTFQTDLDSGKWRRIDFAGQSTVAFSIATGMAEKFGVTLFSPFKLEHAPAVTFRGHLDGPAVGAERHATADVSAHTTGAFTFFGLPFQDVDFDTKLRDDALTVDTSHAKFAGGSVKLHAKLWGTAPERRLGFDASITDASLGVAVAELQRFSAEHKGLPPPRTGRFVQEKANVRADVSASADGLFGDILSFHGNGSAVLRGAEIGAVPLFGPLSALLKFTELRFTNAEATFKIDGPKIHFPSISLRGSNSAVDAHGDYLLDRRELDFRAKVFPFQESGNVIKTVVGAVLTPISNALEVKLTGTADNPDWAFVIGPTNFLRSLSPDSTSPGAPTTPAAAAATNGPVGQPASAEAPPERAPVKPAEKIAPAPPKP